MRPKNLACQREYIDRMKENMIFTLMYIQDLLLNLNQLSAKVPARYVALHSNLKKITSAISEIKVPQSFIKIVFFSFFVFCTLQKITIKCKHIKTQYAKCIHYSKSLYQLYFKSNKNFWNYDQFYA